MVVPEVEAAVVLVCVGEVVNEEVADVAIIVGVDVVELVDEAALAGSVNSNTR